MTTRLPGTKVLPPLEIGQECHSPNMKQAQMPKSDGRLRHKARGRWLALNTFLDRTARHVRSTDAMVWIVLFRDARNGVARVSQQYVADRLGVCRKTVGRAAKRLVQLHLLEIIRSGGFRRGTHTYRLHAESDTP